jgi:hypothetical protein
MFDYAFAEIFRETVAAHCMQGFPGIAEYSPASLVN